MGRISSAVRPGRCAALLLVLAGLLIADSFLRDRGRFDYRLIEAVRAVDGPGISASMHALDLATRTPFMLAAIAVLFVFLVVRHDWLGASVVAILPLALPVALALGELVERRAPDPSLISSAPPATALRDAVFPSIEVLAVTIAVGAWGFFGGRMLPGRYRPLAWLLAVAVILVAGMARIFRAEHWVGDVIAAEALGGALLASVIGAYRRAEPFVDGAPLWRSIVVPHDDAMRHAHALTSTILFRDGTAIKVYNPGFIPRAAYWLAFQARFPYEYNRMALQAAVFRRNLAGMLTEYWYGERRVARALGITEERGRPAIVGELISGTEPRDHHQARVFLFDLAGRFDAAGLPTWQIDPRQPRSLGNLIEQPDGRYMVIDLESGLVSPLASPRAWWRALRRGLVPIFDDVYFDITKAYIAREREAMRARFGDGWVDELDRQVDSAERAALGWHSSEPRIWSRFVRAAMSGFGLGRLRHPRETGRAAEARAQEWITASIDRWEGEGRVTPGEAAQLRDSVHTAEFQMVLPHFGVHLAIGVALRFPLGSIVRASYTAGNMVLAGARLLARRTDRATWRRSMRVHSPLVLVVSAMPAVGTFSYLLAPAVRGSHGLARVIVDAAGEKLPWHVYERLGVRRLVAGPAAKGTVTDSAQPKA